ncbi:hypothetical protein G6M26_10465 [Agrobacterium tumefaciens]|nr:hypothetical protein [Agrobacterium tumefaciens]
MVKAIYFVKSIISIALLKLAKFYHALGLLNFASWVKAIYFVKSIISIALLKLAKFYHALGLLNFASWLIDLRSLGVMVCKGNFVSLNVAFGI